MSRQLIAYVDRAHEGKPAEPGSSQPGAAAFEAWPVLEHARAGGFQRVILITEARFRWDEVIEHLPDRALEETPAAEPPRETPAPPSESTEAPAEPAAATAAESEPGTPERAVAEPEA